MKIENESPKDTNVITEPNKKLEFTPPKTLKYSDTNKESLHKENITNEKLKVESKYSNNKSNNKLNNNSPNKKGYVKSLPLVLLSVSIAFGCYFFYPKSAEIEGVIRDGKDVSVKLDDVDILVDNNIKLTNNDLTGKYKISNLSEGSHNITFSKEGYVPLTKTFNLTKGEKLSLDISLNFNLKKEELSSKMILAINSANNSVSIIDILKNKLIFNLPTGVNPFLATLSKIKSKLFTYNLGESSFGIIDLKNQQELNRINLEKGSQITKMEISSQENKVFALNMSMKKIHVIDTNSNNLLSDINLDKTYTDFAINKFNDELILLDDFGLTSYSSSGSKISEVTFAKSFPRENLKFFSQNKVALFSSQLVKGVLGYNFNKNEGINIQTNENVLDFTLNSYGNKIYILFKDHLAIFDIDKNTFTNENININTQNAFKLENAVNENTIYITDSSSNTIRIFDTRLDKLLDNNILLTENANKILYWDNI